MNKNRHGTYIFRKAVPAHLRPFLPAPYCCKRELLKSLETKDERTAKMRIAAVETTFTNILEQATLAHAQHLAAQGRASEHPSAIPVPAEVAAQIAANDAYRERVLSSLGALDDFPTLFRTPPVGLGFPVFHSTPQTPTSVETIGDASAMTVDCPSIADTIKAYGRQAGVNADTLAGITKDWQMFNDSAALTLESPISDVTRKMVREFRDVLYEHPANTRIRKMMALPIRERCAYAQQHNLPTMSKTTISIKLGRIFAICGQAVADGDIEENPADGLTVRITAEEKAATKGISYSKRDLEAIFSHSIFSTKPWDHKAWLPVLALFTGTRVEELAALLVADVKQIDGVWVFDLSPFDDGGKRVKRIKNFHSHRVIPVHKEIIAAGFLSYLEARKRAGDRQLWPGLKEVDGGRVGDTFSGWWSDQRPVFGITDFRKNFHSFRHLFADLSEAAGLSVKTAFRLTGHSLGGLGAGGRYGNGLSIVEMAEAMNRIQSPVKVPRSI